MAFAHELSWSVSRHGTFSACRRRYYYDYYYSWGGWDRSAEEGRQKAYLLKKMTRMPMLAGDALHQALAAWFEARRGGRQVEPKEVEAHALELLREGYRTSRDGRWRRRPSKLTHLAEHHYAEPRIDESTGAAGEYGKRYVERIKTGVRHFFESPDLAAVRAAPPDSYLALEEMGTIELAGTKAYAIPDFAFREDDAIRIYDWKTGKPRAQDRFQLSVYVLYAQDRWEADPARVVCADVYLPTGELREERFGPDELDDVLAKVESSLAEMRAVHFDADRSAGDPDAFPMLEDPADHECRTCNYRELCGR